MFQLSACSSHQVAQLDEAKRLLDNGYYVDALNKLGALVEERPDDSEAAYLHAWTLHALNLYEDSFPAYEKAMALAPDDPCPHENYANALSWGGTMLSNTKYHEEAIRVSREGIDKFPNRPLLYVTYARSHRELGNPQDAIDALEALSSEGVSAPVYSGILWQTRFDGARVDSVKTKRLRTELRPILDKEKDTVASVPALFKHGMGRILLEEYKIADSLLTVMEQSPEGLEIHGEARWFPFFSREMINAVLSDDKLALFEVTRKWTERFPHWSKGKPMNYARVMTDQLYNTYENLARDSSEILIRDRWIDSVITHGERLIHLDTWRGANRYVRLADFLVQAGNRSEQAIVVCDDGISTLNKGYPGLFYPGTFGDAESRAAMRYTAQLKGIKGKALRQLGRPTEAENLLREASTEFPTGKSYSDLGAFLIDQGRRSEGIDAMLSALAMGFPDYQKDIENTARQLLDEAASEGGFFESTLELDLAERKRQFGEQADRDLIDRRTDTPAAEFELTSVNGDVVRLSDQRGKVVILQYWSPYCGPCVLEWPSYQQLVDEYAGQSDVFFLSICRDLDQEAAKTWLDQRGYTATVLIDEGTGTENGILGIPTILYLDKNGIIAYRSAGFGDPEEFLRTARLRIEELRKG